MTINTLAVHHDVQSDSEHLAAEHGLLKTTAYIRRQPDKERSPGAERVARHRARKKAEGIVSIEVRAELAEAIKSSVGSEDALIQLIRASKLPADTQEARRLAEVGRQFEKLPFLLRWLLLKF